MTIPSSMGSEPLVYMGIDNYNNPPFIQSERNPNSQDIYWRGTRWENTLTQVIFTTPADGVWTTGGGGGGPLTIQTGSGSATSVADVIQFANGSGISMSGAGNTITITNTNTGITAPGYVEVNANYIASPTDYFISVDCTGGPKTITLPANPPDKTQFIIKDRLGAASTTNTITVNAAGGTTIDLAPFEDIIEDFESLRVLYHAGNYQVF